MIIAIERSADNFNKLIMLHQVEILREHLLLDIHRVQEDLYSQTTRHPESRDAILNHVSDMVNGINSCFDCHHTDEVNERLSDIQQQIGQYSGALNRVLDLQVKKAHGLQEAHEKARIIGDSLIGKVDTVIVATHKKLWEQTEHSLRGLHRTKMIVLILVAFGPLLVGVSVFTAIKSLTKPIDILLGATKRIKTGDLDYRIEGLKDEFAELAIAFNDMAGSLREHMRAIEESEKRYRLLFESAADAIFILDAGSEFTGDILKANQAAAKMHGYTVDELLTMNIRDLDTPDAALGIPVRIDRLMSGERLQTEITHQKKDGTVFPVEISAAVFEVGEHKYILAIDRDITERKQAEEALQRAQQIRLAGELATGLAHEIKNPLAGIKVTMAALSEEAYLTEEDRDVLTKVIDEIKRIEYLMKSVLSFARPPKPQFIDTDVNTILDAVASLALKDRSRSGKGSRAITIVRNFETSVPRIHADPMQLQQIFMNLLLNAVDAMPEGGTLVMRTFFDEESSSVGVEISDTGTGVDVAVIDKLFQPFFTTKPKGTGLGLAITKRLVEEHGGKISIQNNRDKGALFKIRLPAANQERVSAG